MQAVTVADRVIFFFWLGCPVYRVFIEILSHFVTPFVTLQSVNIPSITVSVTLYGVFRCISLYFVGQ
jgi:hypothetical protein